MAASLATQSIFASSLTRSPTITKTTTNPCFISSPSTMRMRVRCAAKDGEREQQQVPKTDPSPAPSTTPRKAAVSTKFSDVLAFSGPAPERINGRLAMIGFVAALAVEVANGQDVFAQLSNGGIGWFVGTSVVLSLASLIPLFKGVSVESKSEGLMTSDAELWNGRFAMLGLVALAFTEYLKGGTLV